MRYLPLLLIFLFLSPAFAKEKVIHNEVEHELSTESEIKNKLRVEFHEDGVHKKIKLKDNLAGFEVVDK
jgi:hypothetical protein